MSLQHSTKKFIFFMQAKAIYCCRVVQDATKLVTLPTAGAGKEWGATTHTFFFVKSCTAQPVYNNIAYQA